MSVRPLPSPSESEAELHSETAPLLEEKHAWIRKNLLLILTVAAVFIGAILGFCLRMAKLNDVAISFIELPGTILMHMFKAIIIPLVVISIVNGIGSMETANSGKLNSIAFAYYIGSTVVAVFIGLVLVLVIKPGVQSEHSIKSVPMKPMAPAYVHDAIMDLILNIFPDNLFEATFQSYKTEVTLVSETFTMTTAVHDVDFSSSSVAPSPVPISPPREVRTRVSVKGANILGILVFCIVFAMVMSRHKVEAQAVVKLFQGLDILIMKVVAIIIWYTPIGIIFLIAAKIILIPGDLLVIFKVLWLYGLTVILGLVIQLIVLFTFFFVVTGRNPFRLIAALGPMALTAFGTGSSVAAMPIHFECLEKNYGVAHSICQMVLPVGATINMNGTALYEAVAAIFIAQLSQIDLSFSQVLVISVTATLAAVGAAAIPSGGIFTLVMVLQSANVPIDDISLILTIDWFLDRLRTALNCLSDSVICAVLDHFVKKKLEKEDRMLSEHTTSKRLPGVSTEQQPSGVFQTMTLSELEQEKDPTRPDNTILELKEAGILKSESEKTEKTAVDSVFSGGTKK